MEIYIFISEFIESFIGILFKTNRCDMVIDSYSTVQSSVTPEANRSVALLSRSNSHAATQFDVAESLSEESSAVTTTSATVKV